MSDDPTAAVERRPWWSVDYWKTPATATAIFGTLAVALPRARPALVSMWLVLLIAWTIWSLVSGAYPWSMGWGL
jgi:hypothetical protein